MSWFWVLGGGVCVVVALYLLWHEVTKLTLGENASRLVGTVLATITYGYVMYVNWSGISVWLHGVVLLALVVSAGVFLVRTWEHRAEEYFAGVTSSLALVAAVVLLVAANYLLSQ